MRRFATIAGALAVFLLAALILWVNLGGYALWDPDEGRHAEIAREVYTASDWRGWIVPSINFRPYHDKPILFYWLVGAAYGLGGVNELAARSVPAIAAMVTVLAIYAWAARAWGVSTAVVAAIVCLTAGEFAALGRYANLDMVLTMWITLGVLAVHRWTERANSGASLAPAALWGALGMLTKGLVAPVLIAGIGVLYLAVGRRLRLLAKARLPSAALVFIAVAGPWYATAGFIDPDYLREFFIRHNFQRFFYSARYLHPGPIYYYIPMLIGCFFPWSALLPATIRGTLIRDRRGSHEIFCACWALTIFAFFSLARGKLGTYILPALPPLALLTGRYARGLMAAGNDPTFVERRLLAGGMIFVAVMTFAAVPVLAIWGAQEYGGAFFRISMLAAVMIPVGVAAVVMVRRGRYQHAPLVLGLGMTVCLTVFYSWAAPTISAVHSEAPLARMLAANEPEPRTTPVIAYCVRTPSLLFYLRRSVRQIDRPRQLARVLARNPLVFVVTDPKHIDEMLEVGTLFPWYTEARHVLYASIPPPATPRRKGARRIRERADSS